MKPLTLGIALLFFASAQGQTAPDKYWVRFTDKLENPHSIHQPEAFLSARALDRRALNGVAVSEDDFPVNPHYINAVLDLGEIEYWHQSRWFNAITIKTLNPDKLIEIQSLPFVAETRSVQRYRLDPDPLPLEKSTPHLAFDSSGYGAAWKQISQLNGNLLHAAGYTGKGLWIAVMDAGFTHVDQLTAFDHLREDNRLTHIADLVAGGSFVGQGSLHGTHVLSTMAGMIDGSYAGTAPDAHYFLFRSEDPGSEYIIEEDNWVAAIEMADRLGIDLVNTSLGYSEFDDPSQNHTPDDMDGQTARISRAAAIAASKGMILITSAGNRGASDWRIITAPADAEGILTVGAVDSLGVHAWFSSFGPTADGRVKPDVVAMGRSAAIVTADNGITRANGTSFSAPVTCGLVACLRQAHPLRRSDDIIDAVRKSASLYTNPNDSMGFGIPDFWKAHLILRGPQPSNAPAATIYPNPASDRVNVEWSTEPTPDLQPIWRLIDMSGRTIGIGTLNAIGNKALGNFGLPAGCQTGTYLLELSWGSQHTVIRLQVLRPQ